MIFTMTDSPVFLHAIPQRRVNKITDKCLQNSVRSRKDFTKVSRLEKLDKHSTFDN